MLAASGLYDEGAGCVGIVLGGCWLRRDCITRVLAASGFVFEGAGCVGIVLRGCWLRRDCITRVLAASGFVFEGAGCVGIVLRGLNMKVLATVGWCWLLKGFLNRQLVKNSGLRCWLKKCWLKQTDLLLLPPHHPSPNRSFFLVAKLHFDYNILIIIPSKLFRIFKIPFFTGHIERLECFAFFL